MTPCPDLIYLLTAQLDTSQCRTRGGVGESPQTVLCESLAVLGKGESGWIIAARDRESPSCEPPRDVLRPIHQLTWGPGHAP